MLLAAAAVAVGLVLGGRAADRGGTAEVAADVAPARAVAPSSPVARAEVTTTAPRPAPPAPVPSGPRPRTVAGRVAVVGDSLTVGARAGLEAAADRLGFTLAVSAEEGRRIPEAVDDLSRLAPRADVVVVALGTNDAADRGFDPADAPGLVTMALATVPKDVPVLWVDVWRDPDSDAGADAEAVNRALEAAGRAGRLEVLRWSDRIAADPELVGDDGVHLTDEGYLARAAFIADAVAEHLPASVMPPGTAG